MDEIEEGLYLDNLDNNSKAGSAVDQILKGLEEASENDQEDNGSLLDSQNKDVGNFL